MTQPATTMISVRGDAQRTVAPDQAQLHAAVHHVAGSKGEATSATKRAAGEVTEGLRRLGGRPLTVDSLRAPLTWSVQSMHTQEEYGDMQGRAPGPTGRHACDLTLSITVRDFALLADVTDVLIGRDDVRLNAVRWSVDDDNAAWALVRADAIQAALRKGDDYAAALSGAVIAVEHVADAGLLGGDQTVGLASARPAPMHRNMSGGDVGEVSFDPVPQVLTAIIDARFTATIGALPGR